MFWRRWSPPPPHLGCHVRAAHLFFPRATLGTAFADASPSLCEKTARPRTSLSATAIAHLASRHSIPLLFASSPRAREASASQPSSRRPRSAPPGTGRKRRTADRPASARAWRRRDSTNLGRRGTFASLLPRSSKTVTAGVTTRRYENRSGGGGEHAPRERFLAADAVVRATRLQPNTQLDAAVDRQRDVFGWPLCNEKMREDESRESRERDPNNVQRSRNEGGTPRAPRDLLP